MEVAEKVFYFVIPNEARNLSLIETEEKRHSSARSVARFTENVLRERNEKSFSFAQPG
jgi:hypothetical protein